jgi:hypothetical protein
MTKTDAPQARSRANIDGFYRAIGRKILSSDWERPLVDRQMALKHEKLELTHLQRGLLKMTARIRMKHDQISFYDETLKKQVEGSYRTDGKAVHVRSVEYGIKSAPFGDLGTFIDYESLDLLAEKLLRQLAQEAAAKGVTSHHQA